MSLTALNPKMMCKVHPREEVKLVCETKGCKYQTLCQLCIGKHKGHIIEPLQDFILQGIQKTTQISMYI